MQTIDRWKRELDETLRRLGPSTPAREAEALGSWLSASFRGLPTDLVDALLEGLPERLRRDREQALLWLASVGSILLMDYDGQELARGDWEEIREAFSDYGDEIDLELLTYAMGLVVERGYL